MRQVIFEIPTGFFWLILGLALAVAFGVGAWLLAQHAPHRTLTRTWLKTLCGASLALGVAGTVLGQFFPQGIPIYGYGLMLFVAFIVCTWLAGQRAEQEGIPREHIQDLAIWLFVGGLLGARITFMIEHPPPGGWEMGTFLKQFPQLWDGGVILYGAAIGGALSYALAYVFIVRKHHLSGWRVADIAAPSIAIGIALGRIGCLLNGCCYGHVACPHSPGGSLPVSVCPHGPSVTFPLSAPPRFELVHKGYQTAAGFIMVTPADDPRTVASVDPKSSAGKAGLRPGDIIVMVDDRPISSMDDIRALIRNGKGKLTLTVRRDDKEIDLRYPDPTLADFQTIAHPEGKDEGKEFIDSRVVKAVEPGSPAARASPVGLEKWDRIIKVDGREVADYGQLSRYLASAHEWPRGKAELTLTVLKSDNSDPVTISFVPWTIGLHPTQVYETISMLLLFAVLTFFYPFRRNDGEVMAVLMVGYSVHRFLNEMLRSDARPEGFERWASVALFAAGVGLFLWLRFKPAPISPSFSGGPKATAPAKSSPAPR